MLFAVSEATVPKVSIVLRKSYGAGYFVMNGLAYEADYLAIWPTAEIAVMGPDGMVNITMRKQLEAIPEGKERDEARIAMAEEFRKNIDPYIAAGHAQVVDDVIDPRRHAPRDLARPRGVGDQERAAPLAQARRPPRLTSAFPRQNDTFLCRSDGENDVGARAGFHAGEEEFGDAARAFRQKREQDRALRVTHVATVLLHRRDVSFTRVSSGVSVTRWRR